MCGFAELSRGANKGVSKEGKQRSYQTERSRASREADETRSSSYRYIRRGVRPLERPERWKGRELLPKQKVGTIVRLSPARREGLLGKPKQDRREERK